MAFYEDSVSASAIAALIPWAATLLGCRDQVFIKCCIAKCTMSRIEIVACTTMKTFYYKLTPVNTLLGESSKLVRIHLPNPEQFFHLLLVQGLQKGLPKAID